MVHIVKSENVRSKYMNADGSSTELCNSVNEKFKPIMDEMNKLGT